MALRRALRRQKSVTITSALIAVTVALAVLNWLGWSAAPETPSARASTTAPVRKIGEPSLGACGSSPGKEPNRLVDVQTCDVTIRANHEMIPDCLSLPAIAQIDPSSAR